MVLQLGNTTGAGRDFSQRLLVAVEDLRGVELTDSFNKLDGHTYIDLNT